MTSPNQCPQSRKPRQWSAKGFVPFRLEALTPVCISSGDILSPLDYVIRKKGAGYCLYLIDTGDWLLALADDNDVRATLDRGDMRRLRRLLNDNRTLDPRQCARDAIPIASSTLATNLLDAIMNPDSNAKAEIMAFARNPFTNTAIVPGSSLKGAMLTPIIDCLYKITVAAIKNADMQDGGRSSTEYDVVLKSMFGPIDEHAMQALKVADVAIAPGGTALNEARTMRLDQDGKNTPPKPPCEALRPTQELAPYGSLHLDTQRGATGIILPSGKFVDLPALCKLCNDFYTHRFNDEWRKFYQREHFQEVKARLEPVRQRIQKLNPAKEILLRVGHYSHIECVTITNNKPQCAKGFGKTRTLADGVLPFGWIVLNICDMAEYEAGIVAVDAAIAARRRQFEANRVEQRQAAARIAEQQRQILAAKEKARAAAEAAEQQRQQEEAEREAALAGLSADARIIRELSFAKSADESARLSSALFSRLDALDAELKHEAARALKDCWQAADNWDKKKLSKKQAEKVRKVKALLGE